MEINIDWSPSPIARFYRYPEYVLLYSFLPAHPRERRMYDKMGHHLFWLPIAKNEQMTGKYCSSCAQYQIKTEHEHRLQKLPAAGLLQLGVMAILGMVPKTSLGSQHLSTMTDSI